MSAILTPLAPSAALNPPAAALASFGGMEFAPFRLLPGVSETQLCEAVEAMVAGLYANEPGFLGHALLRGADGRYVDVVFADSAERARALCGKWGTGPFAAACLPYLRAIEPGSAELAFYDRVR